MTVDKEDLYIILERNIRWIENCDLKASILLGIFGVIITICISTEFTQIFKTLVLYCINNINFWTISCLVLIMISILLTLAGIIFLILSLKATISSKEFENRGVDGDSLIFCSSIVYNNETLQEYESSIKDTDKERIRQDIISQIYICSLICDRKFKRYNLGLKIFNGVNWFYSINCCQFFLNSAKNRRDLLRLLIVRSRVQIPPSPFFDNWYFKFVF